MKKIIFIALIFISVGLKAQFKRPFFNTLSVENGLPEGYVRSLLQDKLGYLWFGTQNGLVRYDGYKTKLYPIPGDDGRPAATPSISYIFEDKQNILWINVSDDGYYIYDRQNDVFKRPKAFNASLTKVSIGNSSKFIYDTKNDIGWNLGFDRKAGSWSLELLDLVHGTVDLFNAKSKGRHLIPAGKNCADIMIDSSGNTWLATDSLLNIYDKKSGSFKPYFSLPAGMNKIMFNYLTQDPVNRELLWISTAVMDTSLDVNKVKIIQLNIKTKEYKTYDHLASDPFSVAGTCTEVYIDPLKRMFFYTDNGISLYNRATEKFTNYQLIVPGLSATIPIPINSIAADNAGNLWIGGNFRGLFCLNTTTSLSTYYSHTDEAGSLPDFGPGINKVFFDRAGILWVSMPWSGIAWLDPHRSFFNPVKINAPVNDADKNSNVIVNNISGIYNDSTFFVSNGQQIFTWNYITNNFKNISPVKGKQAPFFGNTIIDKEGLIWITTFGAGLYCYNPVNKSTRNFRNNPKDSSSIGSNNIAQIIEGHNGTLWIGTGDIGLNSFNKKTGKFTRYPFIKNDNNTIANNVLDDDQVGSLICGNDGIIWIGTNNGSLNRFDPKTGKFKSYLDRREGLNCITTIFEDSQNRLWAGSYLSGLFLINKDSGFLKHFTENEGLSSNDVRGITEDIKGNIWLATSHGLSKLNPATNQITNYTTINGLPVVQTNGIYKNSEGLIFVSVKNGVIPFNPVNIIENKVAPEVVIETIKYHLAGNTVNNKDSVLYTEDRQELSLKYNENKISFQYVALHFSNALLNQFAYQLEGYDKEWIPAGTQRSVTYTNLSPGKYIFKVKAANSDGVWNETGARFAFTIRPPWWLTWWAYAIYLIILIFIGWRIHLFQKARTIRIERDKTRDRELTQAKEIEKAYTELKTTQSQLIQSEKMASLGELTAGIAHEIQNPLNFVNNFSEVNKELLIEMKDEMDIGNTDEAKAIANDIIENEEKISFHGKRADAIVKGMLQHSRSSSGVKEPTDINALADEYLRLAYHGLRAKDKSFNATLKTDFDESIGKIDIIPQDIGRVILNLITNAFYAVDEKKKQQPEGYEPTVTVSTEATFPPPGGLRGVKISAKDNGPGIPQKVLDKIFQPFFTTKPTGQGTGLGLSLAYDIVKAHGGELRVETKEGEGTSFIIQIPV